MKIYKWVQNIILILAGVVILTMLSLYFIFNIYPVVVISGSMEPEIATGSMAFIDRDESESIGVGDIIAYKNNEITVVHRVIDIADDGKYITKGDNNDTPDLSPISQEDILGKAVYSISNVGYVLAYIKTTKGVICIITMLVVFVLIGHVLNNNKK